MKPTVHFVFIFLSLTIRVSFFEGCLNKTTNVDNEITSSRELKTSEIETRIPGKININKYHINSLLNSVLSLLKKENINKY